MMALLPWRLRETIPVAQLAAPPTAPSAADAQDANPYTGPYVQSLNQATADNLVLARLMHQLLNSPRTKIHTRWDPGYDNPSQFLELHVHAAVNITPDEADTLRRHQVDRP